MAYREKILVALSGGIDSAVSAWSLYQLGYEVIGITFKLWEYINNEKYCNNLCCSEKVISAAKSICEKIGCEFIVRDVSKSFYNKVVTDFVNEYQSGHTPNPCIICNPHIKWKYLLHVADELKIKRVATGHYARINRSLSGKLNLLRSLDKGKDQSYFLYRLTQEQLGRTIFPVGHISKSQVRIMAAKEALAISSHRESQELCFLPDGGLKYFLQEFAPDAAKQGKIVDSTDRTIGTHKGIAFYTIGQRSGLGGGFKQPMYVTKIIPEENKIVIGPVDKLFREEFNVTDINWIIPKEKEFLCTVQIRHNHKDTPAVVYPDGDNARVIFKQPQPAIAPGQSAVFYQNPVVIAGGTIIGD